MKKKKAMLFWTFDVLHPGHEYVFSQAKNYSDYVIVVLARDMTVKKIKWDLPHHDEMIRQKNLHQSWWVDEVVLGDLDDKYLAVKKHKPDIIVLGYDQSMFVDWLEALIFDEGISLEIKRLKAYKPEAYKSSIFRKKLENNL